MKLTRGADYAVRMLTHLAARKEEAVSEELARQLDIPFNHLAKLVQILGRRGLLITRKGKENRIRLARDPKQIELGEVVEAVEGPLTISDCLFHKDCCRFSEKCKVRRCLSGLRQKMQAVLSEYTIQDLAPTLQ